MGDRLEKPSAVAFLSLFHSFCSSAARSVLCVVAYSFYFSSLHSPPSSSASVNRSCVSCSCLFVFTVNSLSSLIPFVFLSVSLSLFLRHAQCTAQHRNTLCIILRCYCVHNCTRFCNVVFCSGAFLAHTVRTFYIGHHSFVRKVCVIPG